MRLFNKLDCECPSLHFRVDRAEMFRCRLFDLGGGTKSDATQSTNTQTGSGGAGTSGKNSPASAADSILLGSKAVGARDNAVVISAGKDLNSGSIYKNKGDVVFNTTGLSDADKAYLASVAQAGSTPNNSGDIAAAVDAAQIGNQNFVKDLLNATTARAQSMIANPQTWPAWVKPALIGASVLVVGILGWLIFRKKKKTA